MNSFPLSIINPRCISRFFNRENNIVFIYTFQRIHVWIQTLVIFNHRIRHSCFPFSLLCVLFLLNPKRNLVFCRFVRIPMISGGSHHLAISKKFCYEVWIRD
ncbi:hypothetical protein HanRHA438_Chr06g0279751 [Helianthus annuus]|nr:hypothetical protein HanIR_Chr06g0290741 [Helianthus annuus]KAJ0912922.1 hypothetical protein HanRHA438_Chr06g0279751 [Helianthus annuus]